MALFEKKYAKCLKCGKECEQSLLNENCLCYMCSMSEIHLKNSLLGYSEYAHQQNIYSGNIKNAFKNLMSSQDVYTQEQLHEIAAHRDRILEKYRNKDSITRNELAWAANNYKSLNGQQIFDVVTRYSRTSMRQASGMDFNQDATFFSLTTFPGVVIDCEDVFAIGLVSNSKVNKDNPRTDMVVCVMFTNDPYVPVFPIWYTYDLKMSELLYSKQARIDITNVYRLVCPNLTYPITEIKDLKNIVAQEQSVRGNIGKEQMEKYLRSADNCDGIFDTREYDCYVHREIDDVLEYYGFIRGQVADCAIGMQSKPTRDFWSFHIRNIANQMKGKK